LKNKVTDLKTYIGDDLYQAIDKAAGRMLEWVNNGLDNGGIMMPWVGPMSNNDPLTFPGGLGGGPNAQRERRGLDPADAHTPQDIAQALEDAKKSGAGSTPSAPHIPYPSGFGAPPAPGETVEQWQRRMQVMDAEHSVAERQAALTQLESDSTADQNLVVEARNQLIQAQMRVTQLENQQVTAAQAQQAQVPFPAGYGAAPRPGETAAQYGAEQAVYAAQQKSAEARARLAQVEQTATATAEDLVKARNDLAKAEVDEHQAQLRLTESTSKATEQLGQIGSQIDADFGVSKGLSGIVENVTKMLAGFGAAPIVGALAGGQNALGYKSGEAGSGLMGILASSGAFGSQYVRATTSSSPAVSIPDYNPAITLPVPSAPAAAMSSASLGATGWSDAALLAQVPKGGHYDATGDLAKGLVDCTSGIEDLVNIIDGHPTAGRSLYTNGDGTTEEWMASHGFLPNTTGAPVRGAFNIGYNTHHMEGTLPGGTNVNFGSDAAVASGGTAGASGAFDPSFTSHYYRPVGAAAGAIGGSILGGGAGGATPVFVVNMPGGGGISGIPGLAGVDDAAPSSPGSPSSAPGSAAAAPGRAGYTAGRSGGGGGGGGGGYLPLTLAQLTDPGLSNPVPAGAGTGRAGYTAGRSGGAPGGGGGGVGTGGLFPGLIGPPQSLPEIGFPGVGGGPEAGPTVLGGLAPKEGTGGGFGGISGGILGSALGAASSAAGLAVSGAAMGMDGGAGGAAASAAMQIGVQLINRAVGQAGQVAGIAASGLMETLLPFGTSEVAQNNWLTKVIGGVVGARPVMPNIAGGDGKKKAPEGLSPEQAAQFDANGKGPSPEDVAGKPAPDNGQGGGGQASSGAPVTNNYNTTLNTNRDSVSGAARDWDYHMQTMNAGVGQ
jgi:hypothetical protein